MGRACPAVMVGLDDDCRLTHHLAIHGGWGAAALPRRPAGEIRDVRLLHLHGAGRHSRKCDEPDTWLFWLLEHKCAPSCCSLLLPLYLNAVSERVALGKKILELL